jgi:alpha-tubulin suppressor-like RCC1 family protein
VRPSLSSTIRSCLPWAVLTLAVVATSLVLSSRPASAAPLTGIRQIAAGDYHTCALLTSGQVRCAGDGGTGQLGRNTPTDAATGVPVLNPAGTGPLTGVTQLAAGYEHTCAVLTNRQVRCWGYNGSGELGDGSTQDRYLPVPVKGVGGTGRLRNVVAVSASQSHTCAVLTNGQARCWGYNDDGYLGDGTEEQRETPVVVQNVAGTGPLTGVTQISAGDDHTCAVLANDQVRCWGLNNRGELGDGTVQPRHLPVVVKNTAASGPLTGVRQVSAAYGNFTCAAMNDGRARCWGDNTYRQLAHGEGVNTVLPVAVTSTSGAGVLRGVRQVEGGYHGACAVLNSGQVRCWGANGQGELGIGTIGGADRKRPRVVKAVTGPGALTAVTQIDVEDTTVCVRLASGQARCWGNNDDGQLGNGGNQDKPRPVRFQG